MEATTVAHYVINEMLRLGCRFDVRLYANKALPLFQQCRDGEAETDWRDLVTAAIQECLVTVRHADERPSRAARTEGLREIARQILKQHSTRKEQLRAWRDRTGTSERCFYWRKAELEQ